MRMLHIYSYTAHAIAAYYSVYAYPVCITMNSGLSGHIGWVYIYTVGHVGRQTAVTEGQ